MGEVRLKLKEIAQERGFNISQLQRKSGLTMGMIRRYWYNETSQVTLKALGILAHLLDVDPGELLTSELDIHENQQRAKKYDNFITR